MSSLFDLHVYLSPEDYSKLEELILFYRKKTNKRVVRKNSIIRLSLRKLWKEKCSGGIN